MIAEALRVIAEHAASLSRDGLKVKVLVEREGLGLVLSAQDYTASHFLPWPDLSIDDRDFATYVRSQIDQLARQVYR
jgi:hypothetical protein